MLNKKRKQRTYDSTEKRIQKLETAVYSLLGFVLGCLVIAPLLEKLLFG